MDSQVMVFPMRKDKEISRRTSGPTRNAIDFWNHQKDNVFVVVVVNDYEQWNGKLRVMIEQQQKPLKPSKWWYEKWGEKTKDDNG